MSNRMETGLPRSVGFSPVANPDARILILGTLPGKVSLERHQYYAQPRNTFWKIMERLCGTPEHAEYEERIRMFLDHRMALWDVCAEAVRQGSLDTNIQPSTILANDFNSFLATHDQITLVCFNGSRAGKLFRRDALPTLSHSFSKLRYEVLPSTSPAHASMPFETKQALWMAAINSELLGQGSTSVPQVGLQNETR